MLFHETPVQGVLRVEPEKLADERGFFARSWCRKEFAQRGLETRLVQCNIAFSRQRGTLRGLHFQAAPHDETKLVRCTRGAACVVVVDLRRDSPTFLRSCSAELTAENHVALYVPAGCAQGYQTLADNTEMYYQMSEFYLPAAAGGVRYNDPAFSLKWPLPIAMISERDLRWPDFAV